MTVADITLRTRVDTLRWLLFPPRNMIVLTIGCR
jgi:hypothetical protein